MFLELINENISICFKFESLKVQDVICYLFDVFLSANVVRCFYQRPGLGLHFSINTKGGISS